MDGQRCEQFFLEPCQTLQRHYEALRAFFVEQRSVPDIARQFGFAHGTLRNLVCQFRARYQASQMPPFSPNRRADDPAAPASTTPQRVLKSPTLPIAARSR
jgi:transposase-like protein